MSQTRSTATSSADQQEWAQVLAQLRADGFSPIESIKVTRAVLHVSLGEAKRIVHESPAWSDARDEFDVLHDAALEAATQLQA
jgi:ribosomal protein L7/L12